MRIRSTKPEFWRSKTIASVDWDARLVLKGIESYVDDNGVGKDSVVLIAADVFPHDLANNPDTLGRISRALTSLTEAGLLVRYEVDGEPLLYVRRWKSVQRVDKPNRGRHPRPDGTTEYDEDVDESIGAAQTRAGSTAAPEIPESVGTPRGSVANPREGLAPGTGEQGNRGTGEQQTTTSSERAPRTSRGTRLPDDFAVTDEMRAFARELGFVDARIDAITDAFRDYWRSAPGQRGVKKEWPATWRNWMRKEAERLRLVPAGVGASTAGGLKPWEL